jgi:hypothetical protein
VAEQVRDHGSSAGRTGPANVGNKRELIPDECCWPDYVSIPRREARRCNGLIPALNKDTALSRPRMPEWMDKDIGREVEEQEEIAAGFE